MKKYSKEELEELYDNDLNEFINLFKSANYSERKIFKLFNSKSKEIMVQLAQRINLKEIKEHNYHIPLKYNVCENKDLREDRREMYNLMDYDITNKIGKQLQMLYDYNEEEYSIFIHRTANFSERVFEEGIEYGESTSPYIYDHFQEFKNFPFMLREIKYCNNYKGSTGCVIAKIPKDGFSSKSNNPIPIYYKGKDGKTYLKPEYICCYVPVINKELQEIKFRENNITYPFNTEFYFDESIDIMKGKLAS